MITFYAESKLKLIHNDRVFHPTRHSLAGPGTWADSGLVAPPPSTYWPWVPQGHLGNGLVAHKDVRSGLVCHRAKTYVALCATGPERYGPCVPQGHLSRSSEGFYAPLIAVMPARVLT